MPDAYIEDVVRVMVEANWHTYQVLTKRADRLQKLLSGRLRFAATQLISGGASVSRIKRYGLPAYRSLAGGSRSCPIPLSRTALAGLGRFRPCGIHWVIVGGESGRGARPMEEAWVERIYQCCAAGDVPFFFKQWGGVHKSKPVVRCMARHTTICLQRVAAPLPPRKDRFLQLPRSCQNPQLSNG